MYLGVRKVRSAGRNSGSVEVTLPVLLSVLEGVECRLVLRDSLRPELVLEPELGDIHTFFREMWSKVGLGLAEIDDIGDFSAGDFTLTLLSPPRAPERPPLTYEDGLVAMRSRAFLQAETPCAAAPCDVDPGSEAVSRILAALGAAAGYRLGLSRALGDGLGYLMTGSAAGSGAGFERGTAYQAFLESWATAAGRSGEVSSPSPYEERTWRLAQSGLARVFQQHKKWQENPGLYEAARDRWYVALTLEMGVAASVSAIITSNGRAY
jgi:hypothetical protein